MRIEYQNKDIFNGQVKVVISNFGYISPLKIFLQKEGHNNIIIEVAPFFCFKTKLYITVDMKGFTLIEVIVSMAIIAIGILAIFESINSISDTIVKCNDMNYLIHFSESEFNKFKSIETNVYSFSGDVDEKDYVWSYIEDDIVSTIL